MVKHLHRARAGTTNENYESKWKLFVAFAGSKFDPHEASSAHLAEFLPHLFEVRKVSPAKIKGYREAFGHVLRLSSGYDPGEDGIIRLLMKSFDRQKPTSLTKSPTGDISVVLD